MNRLEEAIDAARVSGDIMAGRDADNVFQGTLNDSFVQAERIALLFGLDTSDERVATNQAQAIAMGYVAGFAGRCSINAMRSACRYEENA